MIIENNKIEKMCSFYVSEYHLEMILLPFVNKKIEKKENVIIKTEYNLEETLKVLLNKLNLKEENKNKILNLNWNNENKESIANKSNVIVIGNEKYIENVNKQIREKSLDNMTIVDCYNIENLQDNMHDIVKKYDYNLNTSGFNI